MRHNFSSTTSGTTKHDDFLKHTATKLSTSPEPRAIFPWRHSSYVLDRMDPSLNRNNKNNNVPSSEKRDDDYDDGLQRNHNTIYNPMGPGLPPFPPIPRFLMRMSTESYMQIPLWKSLLTYVPLSPLKWDQELALQFSWAFGKAVASMINNTYHLPPNVDIEQEQQDGTVRIDFHYDSNYDATLYSKNTKQENKEKDNDDEDSDEDEYFDEEDDSHAMIHPKLQQLYTAAHQSTLPVPSDPKDPSSTTTSKSPGGPPPYQITLETTPLNAQIETLYFVPVLTRQHVDAKSHFKGSFQKLLAELAYKRHFEQSNFMELIQHFHDAIFHLNERLPKKWYDADCYAVTIVAQVSILCSERFQVKHVETGEILQGSHDGKEQDVVHLVRFEMVNIVNEHGNLVEMGSWQITDWDDLLDGNVWF